MAHCAVLILAGGSGSRAGSDVPKQYVALNGRSIIERTVAVYLTHPSIDVVQVVIAAPDRNLYAEALPDTDMPPPVVGGGTRQESGLCGLESLENDPPDYVLIHDAARPFVDHATIDRVLAALKTSPAVLPGLPLTDTLKRGAGTPPFVDTTLDRQGLWRAQTPQGFRYPEILRAHRLATGLEMTDDAAIAEHAGLDVALVMGCDDNFKITTAEDIQRAIRMTQPMTGDTRIGSGFDVHAFGDGDHVVLCGVKIGHNRALQGHSDADVAMHAVTDALLGAIAAGDIGSHFPPSEEKWRGTPSRVFLEHAGELIAARGGSIGNIDLTIICETPKIGPHREAMTQSLAEILGVDTDRISIKATTTEQLGFTGRGEGIAAQAAATVRLP